MPRVRYGGTPFNHSLTIASAVSQIHQLFPGMRKAEVVLSDISSDPTPSVGILAAKLPALW